MKNTGSLLACLMLACTLPFLGGCDGGEDDVIYGELIELPPAVQEEIMSPREQEPTEPPVPVDPPAQRDEPEQAGGGPPEPPDTDMHPDWADSDADQVITEGTTVPMSWSLGRDDFRQLSDSDAFAILRVENPMSASMRFTRYVHNGQRWVTSGGLPSWASLEARVITEKWGGIYHDLPISQRDDEVWVVALPRLAIAMINDYHERNDQIRVSIDRTGRDQLTLTIRDESGRALATRPLTAGRSR